MVYKPFAIAIVALFYEIGIRCRKDTWMNYRAFLLRLKSEGRGKKEESFNSECPIPNGQFPND
jgi:hypothetical protein